MTMTESKMTKTANVNELIFLTNGNVWINGREMTQAAYLKMSRREADKLAGEYAKKLAR